MDTATLLLIGYNCSLAAKAGVGKPVFFGPGDNRHISWPLHWADYLATSPDPWRVTDDDSCTWLITTLRGAKSPGEKLGGYSKDLADTAAKYALIEQVNCAHVLHSACCVDALLTGQRPRAHGDALVREKGCKWSSSRCCWLPCRGDASGASVRSDRCPPPGMVHSVSYLLNTTPL